MRRRPAQYAATRRREHSTDAARRGDIQTVGKLLDQGVAPDAKDETGETPMLSASLAGHSDVVAFLVKRGAGMETRNDRGLTPLHGAAYAGSLETVQLLVESGAAVNDADNVFKVTPLILAAEEGHANVISFLAGHGADCVRAASARTSARRV